MNVDSSYNSSHRAMGGYAMRKPWKVAFLVFSVGEPAFGIKLSERCRDDSFGLNMAS